jgi:hypothetical protein
MLIVAGTGLSQHCRPPMPARAAKTVAGRLLAAQGPRHAGPSAPRESSGARPEGGNQRAVVSTIETTDGFVEKGLPHCTSLRATASAAAKVTETPLTRVWVPGDALKAANRTRRRTRPRPDRVRGPLRERARVVRSREQERRPRTGCPRHSAAARAPDRR